jgi:hypothetical protein
MLELHDVAALIEPEQPIIKRWGERQCVGTAIAGIVEPCNRNEHVAQRPVDGCPIAAIDPLVPLMRQQARQLEFRLALVDELLLAIGDGLSRLPNRRRVEGLSVLDMRRNPSHADAKGLSQRWDRDRAAHDSASLVHRRLSAKVILIRLDCREANTKRALHFQIAPFVSRSRAASIAALSISMPKRVGKLRRGAI